MSRDVTIPSGVTEIGSSVFSVCDSLTDIYYTGTEEQWYAINIDNGNDNLNSAIIHCNYAG